jgi:phage shock protein E
MKLIRTIAMSTALVMGVLGVGAFAADSAGPKAPYVIDVRTETEWNAGHLEGAVLIPHELIGERIIKVTDDKKAKIDLYCRTGRRSGIALEVLKKAGYEDVTNLGTMENAADVLGRPIVK